MQIGTKKRGSTKRTVKRQRQGLKMGRKRITKDEVHHAKYCEIYSNGNGDSLTRCKERISGEEQGIDEAGYKR